MTTVKDGLNAIGWEDDFLEQQIISQRKRLKAAIVSLEKRILFLFNEDLKRTGGRLLNTRPKLRQAQKLHTRLTILFEQEFGEATKSIVADFDKLAVEMEKRFKAFDESYTSSPATKESVAALKVSILREFAALGVMMRERVAAALYGATIVGGQFKILEREIRAILTGRYSKVGRPMVSYAGQMAFDQTMFYHNALNRAEAQRADINNFLYYGNVQNNTRPFCRRRVGKIFSRQQIESWTHHWDGKSGPAMTHRGGYNCRHTLVPVRKEWFKGREEEITVQHKEAQKKRRRRKRRAKK